MEILTDLRKDVWPPPDSKCTKETPCPYLKKLIRQGADEIRHEKRLEFQETTDSEEYTPAFCTALSKAIYKHHNIDI